MEGLRAQYEAKVITNNELKKEPTYQKEVARAQVASTFEHQLIAKKANEILAVDVAKYKSNLAKEIEAQKK